MSYATNMKRLLACKKAKHVGVYGECIVRETLMDADFVVITPRDGEGRGDLRAIHPDTGETIVIEVKTARRGSDGRWKFQLWKNDKHGVTSHLHSDVIVLLAALKSGDVVPFVVPVEAARRQKSISIPSHPKDYAGAWAKYRTHMSDLAEAI